MSSAEHAHADPHGAPGHDGHHDFDNEPAKELPADEPRTPGWLPVLGLALFFVAAVAWLWSSGNDDEATSAEATPPERVPAAIQQAAQRPEGALPDQAAPPRPAPPSVGSGSLRQLTPEQARQIQQQIEAVQKQRAAQGQGQQPR